MLLWGMAAVESIISCSEEKSLMVRFPDPKQYLLLKQLEEWNIIVSWDQLGDFTCSSYQSIVPPAPNYIFISFFFLSFYEHWSSKCTY